MNFKKFFFIILITIFVQSFSKKIIFPFKTKTYPFDPEKEFKYILKNEIYTALKVGTPSQKVELYLTTRTPFFIIKKNETFENYFKSDASSTYVPHNENNTFYLSDEVLKHGIHSSEKIYLQNSFEEQSLSQIDNLDFIYCTQYKKDSKYHQGILGLQYFSTYYVYPREINIMVLLKKRGLTSNYVWNLNYTSDDSGYLVIGEYPHTYDEKNYNKENMKQINVHREGIQKVVWNLYFNDIKYGSKDISGRKTGKFSPQYGVILGPDVFDNFIRKEFFDPLVESKKCERKSHNGRYDYYVCDENLDISNFKNIEFNEKDLSSKKFILTKDDLFVKKNGKLYFLIAFREHWKYRYLWHLGKPFMKKYNFAFDEDGNQIIYYEKEENNIIENKNFLIFLWVGIAVLLIIIGVLAFVLVKFVKKRKKKMFELDDEFEYTSGDKNSENNDTSDNNKAFKFEGEEGENKFGI